MQVHPRFLLNFNHWFNADVMSVDQPEKWHADAIQIGIEISSWYELSEILTQLDYILQSRRPQDASQFIQGTNVDWLASDKMTAQLFNLLEVIRNEASAGRR